MQTTDTPKTVYRDDLDGTEILDYQGPVRFSYQGQDYVIDLGPVNRGRLEEALAPFVARASIPPPPPAPEKLLDRVYRWLGVK